MPKWMVTGKTSRCVKKLKTRNLVSNFRPIACLPLIWKSLTVILAEELYRPRKDKFITMGTKGMQKRKLERKQDVTRRDIFDNFYFELLLRQ